METPMKHGYIKMNMEDAREVYIWKDARGYVQTELWIFQQPGWTLYGVSESTGWIYFKKPLIDN